MNFVRNALIVGILCITYLLFIRWSEFQERNAPVNVAQPASTPEVVIADESVPSQQVEISDSTDELSGVPEITVGRDTNTPVVTEQAATIDVRTDNFHVQISKKGGDILGVELLKHLETLESDDPFTLLTQNSGHTYIAKSGMAGGNGPDSAKRGRATYSTQANVFELDDGQDTLVVDLFLEQENAQVIKRYTFERNSYLIDVEYIISNRAETPWLASLYGQIVRDGSEPSYGYMGMQPYLGAAITEPETNYKKIDFDDIDDGPYKLQRTGGWISLVQHYFISAWLPPKDATVDYSMSKTNKGNYQLMFVNEKTVVEPNSVGSVKAQFYAGPKDISKLEEISEHLDLTIDFGWLWFIGKPLFFVMDFFHSLVGNWGIAIILLTAMIKLVFLYPSAKSYQSMAKMRKLQPLMAELKERYGDDRQKMSSELMKIYKEKKVNPLGGCLPIIIQMPVFISLYWVIMESVELRHEPFFLWIADLSVKDPLYILPLLMGVSMWVQQKLNPTPPDPMQARIMQMLPIFFTFLFMFFPAGLVLYWVVNNTLSITQQYFITRQIEKAD